MSKIDWKTYNKSLINRGKINFWISSDVAQSWYFTPTCRSRGACRRYSDAAIEALLIIRFRFSLALRETQGFAESLLALLKWDLTVPDYTTLCRRAWDCGIAAKLSSIPISKSIHVVVDSTGLKVYGEGEWKVRQHGYSKRRTWRKLHLSIDESNGQILSAVLSDNSFKDSEVFEDLMRPVESKGKIQQVTGDGAYDCKKTCFDWVDKRNIKGIFPPRKRARMKQPKLPYDELSTRDKHIVDIRKLGRKEWKKNVNYHRRSLAETGMYRFKTIFGGKLQSRLFDNQATEAFMKCRILNQMPTPAALSL
jgi:Transposase DDE domain